MENEQNEPTPVRIVQVRPRTKSVRYEMPPLTKKAGTPKRNALVEEARAIQINEIHRQRMLIAAWIISMPNAAWTSLWPTFRKLLDGLTIRGEAK